MCECSRLDGLGGSDLDMDMVDGWLRGVLRRASPNFDARPPGCPVRIIVVHAISLPPNVFGGSGVEALFCNMLDPAEHPYYRTLAGLRVSAHFFIRRDGQLIQFVSVNDRAWHAGVSSWRGRERCNDFSVGIELEGSDHVPFEGEQYRCLAELIGILRADYPVDEVVGHADVAPGRKTDPGPRFDWTKLRTTLTKVGVSGLTVRDAIV